MLNKLFSVIFAAIFFCFALNALAQSPTPQPQSIKDKQKVRTMTIPISIFTKEELKEKQTEEYIQIERLIVKEDKDEQTVLSIRSVSNTPLQIAFLIQDDLSSDFNLQIKDTKEFIRSLPRGSRVMIAYLRGGAMQIRQKFTDDLDKAADSLRIVAGSSAVAPRSPYDGVQDALKRFDALPNGRRAIVIFSDGLDSSSGTGNSTPFDSLDLTGAIAKAQRRSTAVYSIYSPASFTESGNSQLILNGQSSLQRLSDETGGRAFFQGSIAPISLLPFFKDLELLLKRQFALTYLSTHLKKGYHKVEVNSTNPEIRIEHPKGYFYR